MLSNREFLLQIDSKKESFKTTVRNILEDGNSNVQKKNIIAGRGGNTHLRGQNLLPHRQASDTSWNFLKTSFFPSKICEYLGSWFERLLFLAKFNSFSTFTRAVLWTLFEALLLGGQFASTKLAYPIIIHNIDTPENFNTSKQRNRTLLGYQSQ